MKDIQTHLNKIRSDAAECLLLSNLVTDGKREVFAKTAEHLNALALEVEKTIATNSADKGTRVASTTGRNETGYSHSSIRRASGAENIDGTAERACRACR